MDPTTDAPLTLATAVAVLGGYLIGSIPFGLLLTRVVLGADVRQSGSGNIGATNVTRVAGRTLGVLTLLLDTAKGFAPVFVCVLLELNTPTLGAVGLATVAGHCFSVFLRFQGGKGVATGLGVFAALHPPGAAIGAAGYALAFALSRISSVGSLTLVTLVLLSGTLFGIPRPILGAEGAIALLILFRHRENIRRLLQGKEARF